jgi:hypothetical protein
LTYVPSFHAKPLGTVKLAVAAGTVYETGVLVTFGLNCAVTEMEAPGANPGAGTVMDHVPPVAVVVNGDPTTPGIVTVMVEPAGAVPLTLVDPA